MGVAAAGGTVNPRTLGPKPGATLGGMLAPVFGPSSGASATPAPTAPELTERGTFFNEEGVEMMPQRGFGGAKAIPYQPQPSAPIPQPLPAPSGFNVNQAAAGALQQAMGGTLGAMTGPLQVGAYMNPYQQAVIERTQQDIERQRQMAANQLGAQATAAGAFGGSRQGVAEGVLAGEYGRMGADIAAQQRQAGYSQAMQSAMADRAARLGAAQQLAGLGRQAFTTGQTIQQQQAQQGLLQQALQQQLIDAARGQYQGYVGEPERAMQLPLQALGQTPYPSTTRSATQPGLFSYLQFAAGLPGMF